MTSSGRFPVPVRSAVKSNLTDDASKTYLTAALSVDLIEGLNCWNML